MLDEGIKIRVKDAKKTGKRRECFFVFCFFSFFLALDMGSRTASPGAQKRIRVKDAKKTGEIR